MDRFTVTTPIFYVNARPHIGHAYTMIVADVLARYHRNRGADVWFLTGTDEHGQKVAEAAREAGKSPQALADAVVKDFQAAWKGVGIGYSDFIRTTESRHVDGVTQALARLHAAGALYEKAYRGLYCPGCEAFVTEKDLDEHGLEPLHQKKPTVVEETNWFFRFSAYAGEVKKRIERGDLAILPHERRNEVLGLFAQGIGDFSLSRSRERVPWGIPLPFDPSQTAYVWVDALLNYITALGYGSGDLSAFKTYWPADVQVIGQDILKFHAITWPAMLLALDLPLPRSLLVHGFFTVNGKKISKSLGNAVDPLELVRQYGADATRYLLLTAFPFGQSGDINIRALKGKFRADLADTYGNLVARVATLVAEHCDGSVPTADADAAALAPIAAAHAEAAKAAAENRSDALLAVLGRALASLGQHLNVTIDRAAPWKPENAVNREEVLRTMLEGVFRLTNLLAPLLPSTAGVVRGAFSASGQPYGGDARLADGARVAVPPILFPKT